MHSATTTTTLTPSIPPPNSIFSGRLLLWFLAILPLAFVLLTGVPYLIKLSKWETAKHHQKKTYSPVNNNNNQSTDEEEDEDDEDDDHEQEYENAPLLGASSSTTTTTTTSNHPSSTAVDEESGLGNADSTASAENLFGIPAKEIDPKSHISVSDIRLSLHRDYQLRWVTVALTVITVLVSGFHTFVLSKEASDNETGPDATIEDVVLAASNTLAWILALGCTFANAYFHNPSASSLTDASSSSTTTSKKNKKTSGSLAHHPPSYTNGILAFNLIMVGVSLVQTARLYDLYNNMGNNDTPKDMWGWQSSFLHSLLGLICAVLLMVVDVARRSVRIDPNMLRQGKFRVSVYCPKRYQRTIGCCWRAFFFFFFFFLFL
jgi:cytoskeletal protein RodZ